MSIRIVFVNWVLIRLICWIRKKKKHHLFVHLRIVGRRTIERYSHYILGRHRSDRIYIYTTRCSRRLILSKMNSIRLQLNDLPIEILLIIFRKLHNAKLFHCLFDTNQWLNEILCHPILISRLNLLEFDSIDSISPLPFPILHRLCVEILPKIHEKIQWLNLESFSIRFAFFFAKYPNLNGLGLYNLEMKEAENLLSGKHLNDEMFSKTANSLKRND